MVIQELTLASGTRVLITAPGFRVETLQKRALADIAPNIDLPAEWLDAMTKNGVAPDIEALPIQLTPAPDASEMIVTRKGSPRAHVEIAAQPKPDHTLLLMVRRGESVQWFVPVNAPRIVPQHAGMRKRFAGDPVPQPLRFVVPAPMMESRDAPSHVAQKGLFGRVLSWLVHVPLVRDLIDAPVRWLVAHIAKHVESRNKNEGFKFFDDAGEFPLISREQIDAMAASDKPVLFLIHGIFSSLRGAFRQLSGSATLAALRAKYGENIIGWDHWTISKTPLENADDMLTRMSPSMNVDFICHSRGALVMRAALEHDDLREKRRTRFRESGVGSAMFVAGANQGSQLANYEHVNTLLNVYSAISRVFGSVALEVVFAVLRVLAHGASTLPSIHALSNDASNTFVRELNAQPRMSVRGKLVVAHANYDPSSGLLQELADLNIDTIFAAANDAVVPFAGAAIFDPAVIADESRAFGSAIVAQADVMHTNFFGHDAVRTLIEETFLT